MLASTSKQLENKIITLLSAHPRLTALELHHRVQVGRPYSIQGVYKELRKLERNGVLVKEHGRYSLRLPWVLSILSLAQGIEKNYLLSAQKVITLPSKGNKQILHFTNLLQLNNYWSQVLIFMIQHAEKKRLLTYMPHPWYHLIYTEEEQQYIEAVRKTGTELYIINRSKTYLDAWAKKFWDEPHIEHSFSNDPFKNQPKNVYLNTIDDYVLTVKLGTVITKDIEQLYKKTTGPEDIDYSEVFRVFNQKVKTTFWLEKNEKKAKRIEGIFRRHFGIKKG